ncbi:MAG: chromosome segregation protein SMC [Chloroflexota bacterium]
MNLRKLELAGFKTFARRTELPLPPGLTSIVGPNGSGKSNLADALRWVLGEQSLQHIRSKKTEDVIFAGGGNRPAMGMAEVTLTLDNTSGWIPLDFSEVTLTRRAHRSGENEYFINGSRVRLRDITDLRNRAGFGQSSYSVIGQGLVDAVLSQRPEERRALFEEAAGIKHYQSRRDHTLDQLATTQQNLLRVGDIVAEIEPRLMSLRNQAEKARQFERLSDELRGLQIRWFAGRFRHLAHQQAEAQARLTEAQTALAAASQADSRLEAAATRLDNDRQAAERSLAEHTQRAQDLARQKQHVQGQVDLALDKLAFMERQGHDGEREMSELAQAQAELEQQRFASAAELETLRGAEVALQEQIRQLEGEAALRLAGQREAEQWTQEAREELQRTVSAIERRKHEIEDLTRRKRDLAAQASQHEQDLGRKTGLTTALKEKSESLQAEAQRLRAEGERISGDVEAARLAAAAGQLAARQQQGVQEQARRRHHELATRLRLLQELRQNLEGLDEGTKTLAASGRPEVLGPLAEQLKVRPGYERAIAAGLGHKLQAILVEHSAGVPALMDLIPTSAGTLFPGPWPLPTPPSPAAPGLPAALDLVEVAHPAAMTLLVGLAIAPDLPTALAHHQPGLRIATMNGEMLDMDGTITRYAAAAGEAVLKRQGALEGLSAEVAEALSVLRAAEADLRRLENDLADKSRTLERVDIQARQRADQRKHVLNEARDLSQQIQGAQAQMDWLTSLKAKIEADLQAVDLRHSGLTAELDQLQERLPDLRQALDRRHKEVSTIRQTHESEADRPSQLRVELGVTRQRIQHADGRVKEAAAGLAHAEKQLSIRRQRSDEHSRTLAALKSETERHRAQMVQLERQLKEEQELLAPLGNKLATLVAETKRVRLEEAAAREQQSELDKTCYRLAFDAQRKQDELDALGAALLDELHLTPDLLPEPEQGSPEPTKKEVDQLKARMAGLGAVNTGALAEYQEVEQRHAFLTSQSSDLTAASARLQQVIAELEELTERQFQETFQAVEREFPRFFELMFNGGRVELFLTDPEHVTTSGIEILAQPPGKRLQNLAALSGGERALVAASLLFAILSVKPVPFCLLDEVDAALDEANVNRFGEALKSLAGATQFVVITHNRGTMAMADALYGVSMGQDGVSKLVSLRLSRDEPVVQPSAAERPALVAMGEG